MITPLSESLCVLKEERSSFEFHQFTIHVIVLIDGEALRFGPISFGTCGLARTSHVSLVSQEVSRHVRRSDCRSARLVEFRLTPRWGHRHFRW